MALRLESVADELEEDERKQQVAFVRHRRAAPQVVAANKSDMATPEQIETFRKYI